MPVVPLPREHAAAFVALVFAGRPDPAAALARIEALPAPTGRDLVLLEGDELVAGLRLSPSGGGAFELVAPRSVRPVPRARAAELVAAALARAEAEAATHLSCHYERPDPAWVAALCEAGFVHQGDRIEYQAPVAALPDDAGTPLAWRDLAAVGFDAAAALLDRAAVGAPDWDPAADDGATALRGYLADPVLTTGPETVAVGFLDDRPAAFVCAQVNPRTRWGRLTWVAVAPEHRGQGLGAWTHRRGFAMLQAQGATTYRGGTMATNPAMRRLFEKHGVPEVARMADLAWRPAGARGAG